MMLHHNLLALAENLAGQRDRDGSLYLRASSARLVLSILMEAIKAARHLEGALYPALFDDNCRCVVTPTTGSSSADLVAFALQGEPRPSAEVLDLSEIMAREHQGRPAPEVLTEAKLYVFPTVPRFPFNGGDVA